MKRPLIILAALFGTLALLAWTGAWLSTPSTKDAASFAVAKGEGTDAIVRHLKEQGVIRSELFFKLSLSNSGLATKLQPGTYDFRGAADFAEIIRRLASGGVPANEFVLLVKEGWNLSDIKDALAAAGYAQTDKLFFVTGLPATDHRTLDSDKAPQPADFSAEFPFLKDKPSYVSLEGFLFPDTYRLFRDATPEEIVRTMLANFDRRLTPSIRQQLAERKVSVYDAVTLASVIEREVRGEEDRRKVADIFWRRLDAGMALQADSTVNYATGKSLPSVSLEDTKTDSRYNTYKYPGLPLGPIANPGSMALEAAAYPEPNDAWYFLTGEDGIVHYARTLDEHDRNKAKYLK